MMQLVTLWIVSSLSLLWTNSVWAKAKLAGLEVIKIKVPVELELMTKHLATHVQERDQAVEVVHYANLINKDMAMTNKAISLYLIKSEIYRNFLKGSLIPEKTRVNVNTTLIHSVREKLKKGTYSEFTQWFINSALDDLDNFATSGVLDNKEKISRYNAKDQLLADELDKKLKFLAPWLIAFEKLPAKEFEEIITNTAVATLKALSTKAFYFGKFSSSQERQESVSIFSIPQVSLDNPSTEPVPQSLTEQAKEKKQKAEEVVKQIAPDDLSQASEKIDEVLSPANEEWTPQ